MGRCPKAELAPNATNNLLVIAVLLPVQCSSIFNRRRFVVCFVLSEQDGVVEIVPWPAIIVSIVNANSRLLRYHQEEANDNDSSAGTVSCFFV